MAACRFLFPTIYGRVCFFFLVCNSLFDGHHRPVMEAADAPMLEIQKGQSKTIDHPLENAVQKENQKKRRNKYV